MAKVLSEKPSLVWRKFVKGLGYTVVLAVVNYALEYFATTPVDQGQVIFVGVLVSLLQALKKALEEYDHKRYLVSTRRRK